MCVALEDETEPTTSKPEHVGTCNMATMGINILVFCSTFDAFGVLKSFKFCGKCSQETMLPPFRNVSTLFLLYFIKNVSCVNLRKSDCSTFAKVFCKLFVLILQYFVLKTVTFIPIMATSEVDSKWILINVIIADDDKDNNDKFTKS